MPALQMKPPTNAVKYGALRQPDAHLSISWSLETDGEPSKSPARIIEVAGKGSRGQPENPNSFCTQGCWIPATSRLQGQRFQAEHAFLRHRMPDNQ